MAPDGDKGPVDPAAQVQDPAGAPAAEAKAEKTPYELLKANKAAALAFADSIQKNDKPKKNKQPLVDVKTEEVQDLVSKATSENAIDELTKAIAKLDEIKDNRIGIVWRSSTELLDQEGRPINGTRALVRDARNVETNPEILRQEAPEKYAIQILNQTRAAIDLIDKDSTIVDDTSRDDAKRKLMQVAQEAVKNIENLNSSTVKNYNQRTLNVLKAAGVQEAAERLNFAKEIVGFGKDEHRHIVTLTTAKDSLRDEHTVAEADIMLNGLTSTQQKEYLQIAELYEKPKSDLEKPLGIAWFDNMEPYKKALLIPVAGDIASGKKVLSSQLLHDLPGLRNAYQKVTAIKQQKKEGESPQPKFKILAATLHCGAPVSKATFASNKKLSKAEKAAQKKDPKATPKLTKKGKKVNKANQKKERQRIANENISQLQLFVLNGQSLNLNTLNSKDIGRTENYIFDQISQAQKDAQSKASGAPKPFTSTASPLNAFRYLRGGGRDTKQFQTNLSEIARGLELSDTKDVNDIIKYLQKGNAKGDKLKKAVSLGSSQTNQDKAREQLLALREKNPDLAKVLTHAVDAKALIDSKIILSPSRRISVELTAKMNAIAHSVKNPEGALYKEFVLIPRRFFDFSKYPNSVDFCKSGKDRTGYVQTKNTQLLVASELDFDINDDLGRANFKSQVAGGHTQEMAGIQGGTPGCHGIKDKTGVKAGVAFMSPEDRDDVGGILTPKSAGYNNEIKVPKGKEEGKGKDKVKVVRVQEYKAVQPLEELQVVDSAVQSIPISDWLNPDSNKPAAGALASDMISSGSSGNKSANSDIDPITQAVRTEILEKQQAYVLEKLKEINSALDLASYENDNNKANIRELLRNHAKEIEKLLENKEVQNGLRNIERDGYAAINRQFADRFKDIEWVEKEGQRSIEIKGIDDKPLCTLVEVKINVVSDVLGPKRNIRYRKIEFPNEVNSGAGPLHLQIAIRDEHGKDIDGAKFSVHYENGKLTEFSHPIPIKFLGEKDDAIGYTEINGKLAIFPITRGNYDELTKQLEENRGVQAGLGQGAVVDVVPQEPKTVVAQRVGGVGGQAQDFAVGQGAVPAQGAVAASAPPQNLVFTEEFVYQEQKKVGANPQDEPNLEVPAQGAVAASAPPQNLVFTPDKPVDVQDAIQAAAVPGNNLDGKPLSPDVAESSLAARARLADPVQLAPPQAPASPVRSRAQSEHTPPQVKTDRRHSI